MPDHTAKSITLSLSRRKERLAPKQLPGQSGRLCRGLSPRLQAQKGECGRARGACLHTAATTAQQAQANSENLAGLNTRLNWQIVGLVTATNAVPVVAVELIPRRLGWRAAGGPSFPR